MTFSDQLKKIKKDLENQEKSVKKQAIEKMARPPKAPKPVQKTKGHAAPQPAESHLSDDELFAQSIAGIGKNEVYRGKFGDPLDKWEPQKEVDKKAEAKTHAEEAEARQFVEELREQRTFEEVVGKLDKRFKGEKYHVPNKATAIAAATPLHTESLALDSDGLRSVEVTPAHRELLKRADIYRKEKRIPELNLRGRTKDDALLRLEGFLDIARRRGDRYGRVIHGKGKGSQDDPVIKPAVLIWCEGPGAKFVAGYAPEVSDDGDYGSIMLEFRKT